MEMLLLKAHGLSHEQIEEIVGVTGNTIREYFDLYQQGGIEKLKEIKLDSKPSSLIINSKNQIIKILPVVLISIALSLAGVAGIVLVARITDNPIWQLAKDLAQVISFPPYIGLLSN